jgi:hypothetical protein
LEKPRPALISKTAEAFTEVNEGNQGREAMPRLGSSFTLLSSVQIPNFVSAPNPPDPWEKFWFGVCDLRA